MIPKEQLTSIKCNSIPDAEWKQFLEARGMKRAGKVTAFSSRKENAIYMRASTWANATDGDTKDLDDKLCYHEWLHLFVKDMHVVVKDWKGGLKAFIQCFKFGFDCRCAMTQAMWRWGPKKYLNDYYRFVDMLRTGEIPIHEV